MSITRMAGSSYTLQRLSPYLLDPMTAASGGSHVPDRQPSSPCSVQVHALAAGTVVVAGTVDGGSTTETLTFTGAGYRATAKRFSAITTITPAGALLGTTFSAKSLAADGSPNQKMRGNVGTGIPAAFDPKVPSWVNRRDVQTETRQAMISLDYRNDLDPRRGDFWLDEQTSELWQIQGVNLLHGGRRPHHWETWVSLWDGESP